ncbi:MAG: hypothetical protein GF308_13055 [Candidatus Heimdallarchaeota archaeon]|nr:hypothetical protein [Candidatus Heimdallarchaeota archaeon]
MVSVGVIKIRCDACKKVITGKYIHFSDHSTFCMDCYKSLPKCLACKKPIIDGDDMVRDGLCPKCYLIAPKCDICDKAIFGSYTRFYDGTISCDKCMKKYSNCDRCGKPVVKYTKVRGKVLCKYCLKHAPRCYVCNYPIIGTYWVFDKKLVCDHCYTTYERCDLCGLPSQILFAVYDKKICYSCQQQSKRCSACGLPIVGRYYSYKNQSGIYCAHCEQMSPHCDSCGRPVGLKFMEISDGRKICLECQSSAIKTDEQLQELIKITKKEMQKIGLSFQHSIFSRLISKKLLDQRIEEAGAAVTAGKNLGLFEKKAGTLKIFIQSHLPLQIALGTICHELTHAWQSQHVKTENQSPIIREGFAEWVSYRVLKSLGYKEQAEMILSRNDIYGLGFQKIYDFEKKHGVKTLLEWVKYAK